MNLRPTQRLLDEVSILQLERDEQLLRAFLPETVRTGEKRLEHLRIRLVFDVGEELMIAREHLAAPYPQPCHTGVVAVAREAEHVAVPSLHLEDDRRLLHALEMLQH